MAVQRAVSGNPYKNNGGVVVKAGNVSSDSPVSRLTILSNSQYDGSYGAKITLAGGTAGQSGHLGTFNPKSTFAYRMVEGEFIVHGKGVTRKINGAASNAIASGAADTGGRRPIAFKENTRRLNITSWNAVTGAATKGANAGALSSFGTDDAARPTDAVPGEICYKTGKLNPVQDEFKPRLG